MELECGKYYTLTEGGTTVKVISINRKFHRAFLLSNRKFTYSCMDVCQYSYFKKLAFKYGCIKSGTTCFCTYSYQVLAIPLPLLKGLIKIGE